MQDRLPRYATARLPFPPMPLATATPLTFTLAYDAAANNLLATWTGSPAPDTALHAHYAELLAAAQAHSGCRFWLLDRRQRAWHSPTFGHWFGHDFAARVEATLGRPTFIAYLLTPTQHQASADGPGGEATQRACAAHNVYPFFFGDELAALAWLRHQQALDAA